MEPYELAFLGSVLISVGIAFFTWVVLNLYRRYDRKRMLAEEGLLSQDKEEEQ